MKTLVIYDSQFGNTKKIAEIIAKTHSAKLLSASEVNFSDLVGIDQLIVGSPTHGGQPTPALREFIENIPRDRLKNVKAAAFDTRFSEEKSGYFLKMIIRFFGYAAPKIAQILESKGGKLISPPMGFIVKGKEGPLDKDEISRATTFLKDST